MTAEVIVAILALVGTSIGSLGGVLAANKLVNYRLQQLENKVDKHNKVIERVFKLESDEEVFENEIKDIERRLNKLETYH